MTKEQAHSLDGFLETLEKRSRAARTISIVITMATIALCAVILFFVIRAISREQARLRDVQQQVAQAEAKRDEAKKQLDSVSERLDYYSTALSAALKQIPKDKQDTLLEKAARTTEATADSPKVYLQILDNNQRPQAKLISDQLSQNNFRVQGIEWVRLPITISKTQVRYFRQDYADQAKQIVSLLQRNGVSNATAVPMNLSAGTSQIEIWFSADAFPPKLEQTSPGPNKGLESLALARTASDVLFEFLEALKRPAEKMKQPGNYRESLHYLKRGAMLSRF